MITMLESTIASEWKIMTNLCSENCSIDVKILWQIHLSRNNTKYNKGQISQIQLYILNVNSKNARIC